MWNFKEIFEGFLRNYSRILKKISQGYKRELLNNCFFFFNIFKGCLFEVKSGYLNTFLKYFARNFSSILTRNFKDIFEGFLRNYLRIFKQISQGHKLKFFKFFFKFLKDFFFFSQDITRILKDLFLNILQGTFQGYK